MEEKWKSAAAYIRVSTEEQTEFSPDAQKKALQQFAKYNGYILKERNIFTDEGISGRQAEKRPAFMEMIARAKSPEHPFDVILVHKFDRFARNREDSIVYKSLLKRECGVRVISITENIEHDKFSVILEAILEAMAEYYSINLAEEVKKGMTEKALRGGFQTSPPYGYTVKNNQLITVPEEANIVRHIFSLYNAGYSYSEIARALNQIDVKTHRGHPFEGRTVKYILNNPVYIGKLRWNPKGKSEKIGVSDLIVAEGTHEACIDRETWELACRKMLHTKRSISLPLQDKHWLSGVLRCAECGRPMIFVQPNYFKCSGYNKGCCPVSQHIRADILSHAVIAKIKKDIDIEADIDCRNIEFSAIAVLEQKVKKLEQKKEKLREAYLNGIDGLTEYEARKKNLEQEILLCRKQKKEAEGKCPADLSQAFSLSLPNAVLMHAASAIIKSCTWNKETRKLRLTYY